MSGRVFLAVVAGCWLFLLVRTTVQPAFSDFDEYVHVQMVLDIRRLGGLPGPEHFPAIQMMESGTPKFHDLPPLPYLLMAGVSALGTPARTHDQALPYTRAVSLSATMLMLLIAGLATRKLMPAGRDWTAASLVPLGLTLLPGIQAMAASSTAEAIAAMAIAALTLATAHAMRSGWTRWSIVWVGLASALLLSTRSTVYPFLLIGPAGLLASRLRPAQMAWAFPALAALAVLPNLWWWIRAYTIFGDFMGGAAERAALMRSLAASAREMPLWVEASSGPVPALSLLLNSEWLWVHQSRMLLRQTWVEPVALALWIGVVVAPAGLLSLRWLVRRGRLARGPASVLLASAAATAVTLAGTVWLSASSGHMAVERYVFMGLIPLAIAVAAAMGSEQGRAWALSASAAICFAAALTVRHLAML